jgi:hypothetical protein
MLLSVAQTISISGIVEVDISEGIAGATVKIENVSKG